MSLKNHVLGAVGELVEVCGSRYKVSLLFLKWISYIYAGWEFFRSIRGVVLMIYTRSTTICFVEVVGKVIKKLIQ